MNMRHGSVSRTGTPSPTIKVDWTENDAWRPGDPPRDPNYSDRYFTFRLDHSKGAPEPVNVIEAWVHDHTAYGQPEFRWEVDGTSQWGDQFGEGGTTSDLDRAKGWAADAVQRASDGFWAKYDDSETPKGAPGGFPWDRRSSKTAGSGACSACTIAHLDDVPHDDCIGGSCSCAGANHVYGLERVEEPGRFKRTMDAIIDTLTLAKKASGAEVCLNCGSKLDWRTDWSERVSYYCPSCGSSGTEAEYDEDKARQVEASNPRNPKAAAGTSAEVDAFKGLIDPDLAAALSGDDATSLWGRLISEPFPPHLFDAEVGADEMQRRRARELATNLLIDRRMGSTAAAASDDLTFEPDPVEGSYLNAWIDGVCVARIDTRTKDVRWIDRMDSRHNSTLAAAKGVIRDRLDRPSYRRLLTEAPVGNAWPKTALNEQKAPPQVDTLRDEQCPVCGEQDAYSGDECGVCGFKKPPDAFLDPDVEKAKAMDLRQDQTEEVGEPAAASGGVQCDNCGANFGADGAATPGAAKPNAVGAPATGTGLERFKVAAKRDPFAEGQRAGRGKNPNHTYWCPWSKGTPEAEQYRKGWEQASGQTWSAKQAVLPPPDQDGDAGGEALPSTAPQAGDQCPECGEGTLRPVEPAASPPEGPPTDQEPIAPETQVNEAPADPGEGDTPTEPGADPESAPESESTEGAPPGVEPEKGKPEEDEDDEDEPKKPKPGETQKESSMRPTLRRLAESQINQEVLGEAVRTIAAAAGIDLTPIAVKGQQRLAAFRAQADSIPDGSVVTEDKAAFAAVTASRQVKADVENPANPIPDPPAVAPAPEMTTEVAKTPEATTDVTAPMGEVATTDVPPDANTSLQDTGTVLDVPLDLNEVDVTAPVTGTQENEGAHKVEHDISSGVDSPPNNEPAFPLGGPFAEQAKVTGSREARVWSSLRLARLRIQAGIVPAQDDTLLGQAIANEASLTDQALAAEIETLAKVVTASANASTQRQPVSRSLVPTTAARQQAPVGAPVERAVPSLVTSASAQVEAGSQAVSDDEMLW